MTTERIQILEPQRDRQIEGWLAMFGFGREALLDWLAMCVRSEHSKQALFLEGEKCSGKSLLVRGLARLWVGRVLEIEDPSELVPGGLFIVCRNYSGVEDGLHVEVGRGAAEYLDDLPSETIEGWVEGDGIARHVLWLSENRVSKIAERSGTGA